MVKAHKDNADYAVKVLVSPAADSLAQNCQFNLEQNILRELNHAQIPKLHEAFAHDGTYYLVLDYIDGYPLSYYLNQGRKFSPAEVIKLLAQLLTILDYLHTKKKPVVHRDLRLANLLLKNDSVYLVDFGLARYLPPNDWQNGSDPVSLQEKGDAYAAQVRPGRDTYRLLRKQVAVGSDLFGAGVVAVDLLSNLVDDQVKSQQPWQEALPISAEFKAYLERLLSTNGFSNCQEAIKALDML